MASAKNVDSGRDPFTREPTDDTMDAVKAVMAKAVVNMPVAKTREFAGFVEDSNFKKVPGQETHQATSLHVRRHLSAKTAKYLVGVLQTVWQAYGVAHEFPGGDGDAGVLAELKDLAEFAGETWSQEAEDQLQRLRRAGEDTRPRPELFFTMTPLVKVSTDLTAAEILVSFGRNGC
jgi:hypothetical protein